MKISKTQLMQIIKEEMESLMEQNTILSGDPEANALRDAIANFIDSHRLDNPSKTVMAITKEFLDNYKKGLMSQAALGGSFFEGQLKEGGSAWDWAHAPDSPSDSDADDYEPQGSIYDDITRTETSAKLRMTIDDILGKHLGAGKYSIKLLNDLVSAVYDGPYE